MSRIIPCRISSVSSTLSNSRRRLQIGPGGVSGHCRTWCRPVSIVSNSGLIMPEHICSAQTCGSPQLSGFHIPSVCDRSREIFLMPSAAPVETMQSLLQKQLAVQKEILDAQSKMLAVQHEILRKMIIIIIRTHSDVINRAVRGQPCHV